jgi:predicted heme/steroid binding protein
MDDTHQALRTAGTDIMRDAASEKLHGMSWEKNDIYFTIHWEDFNDDPKVTATTEEQEEIYEVSL